VFVLTINHNSLIINTLPPLRKLPERQDFHNRRSATCGTKTAPQPLPERQDAGKRKSCLAGSGQEQRISAGTLSLTYGYEDYVPSGLAVGFG
jgi:hypothetical protein